MKTGNGRTGIGARALRATLLAPAETGDEAGGRVLAFAAELKLWLRPMTAAGERGDAETGEASGRAPALQRRFITRFRDGLDPGKRILAGGALYELTGRFDPDGRRRDLILICRPLDGGA